MITNVTVHLCIYDVADNKLAELSAVILLIGWFNQIRSMHSLDLHLTVQSYYGPATIPYYHWHTHDFISHILARSVSSSLKFVSRTVAHSSHWFVASTVACRSGFVLPLNQMCGACHVQIL
jgi:hypothetical protein